MTVLNKGAYLGHLNSILNIPIGRRDLNLMICLLDGKIQNAFIGGQRVAIRFD